MGIYSDPGHVFAYDDGEVRQEFSICFSARPMAGTLTVSDESHDVRYFTRPTSMICPWSNPSGYGSPTTSPSEAQRFASRRLPRHVARSVGTPARTPAHQPAIARAVTASGPYRSPISCTRLSRETGTPIRTGRQITERQRMIKRSVLERELVAVAVDPSQTASIRAPE